MTAGLSYLLLSLLDYRSIGLLLLLPVLASALFARPTVIVGASVAAALIWDFFFIEPYFTFVVDKHEDYLMLLVFLVVAGVTGVLTGRFRRQRGILEIRERQTNSLYRLTRSLAQADSASEMAQIAAKEIEALVGTGVQIYLRRDIGEGLDAAAGEFGEKERAVAEWVLKNGRAAGRFTSTLPAAEGAYYPVMTAESVLGVIGLRPLKQRPRAETILFLETLGAQVGLALQRDRLRQATRIAEMAQESERLSRNLLNVVSHELKTPLTAILTAADSLRGQHDSTSGGELLSAIEENGRRLTLIVDHMLESSRLEAGRVVVKQMPVDLRDIIASTLRRLEPELRSRTVEVDCPAALAFLETDEILLGTILRNLVHNACLHTPADAPIRLRVSSRERWLDIFVEDEGLGVEPSRRGKVFDKFWRGPDVAPGGLGLGLSLARGLAEALGGTLELIDGSSKGATFRLSLPSKGRP